MHEPSPPQPPGGNPPQDRNAGGAPWQTRRRLMFTVSGFCMACITWALWVDSDTQVMQAAVAGGFGTMTAIVGSYVFGAVWEDKR